ncbi:DUF2189 domain-containing protein [Nitrogeniibacter mangrovi]|uniref:DUF2189 domain-containing protein n=1 Tax=Nitrogeniibacter mangrovi TaxID=2016596 RepID=A0A6C1B0L6_9RHOO|nr:DUF2189 domain-containing protein [Nitrogeniibacter mangrovi]QID17161.1 DUF2189 domain-containing protein [Nitrogeniibacter mangrovi]
MEKPADFLSQHFAIPHIREVTPQRPLDWLSRGWSDMRDNLGASVCYGLFFAVIGYALLTFAAPRPYLFTTAISGFLLVGPLAAAGLYEISRRHERGRNSSFRSSLAGLRRRADVLLHFGLLLALLLIAWERISAVVFALFYADNVPDLGNFLQSIILSGEHTALLVAYLFVGGTLAVLVFCATVIAIPMMMARDTDMLTAMATSARAVAVNPLPMLVWAVLIVALVAMGFATLMVGMVILLPLLGHASWHAYRDMVG